jgi:hypothetical protein
MKLYFVFRTIGQSNSGDSLELSPPASTICPAQMRPYLDTCASRYNLDGADWVNNLELHPVK